MREDSCEYVHSFAVNNPRGLLGKKTEPRREDQSMKERKYQFLSGPPSSLPGFLGAQTHLKMLLQGKGETRQTQSGRDKLRTWQAAQPQRGFQN
jgi:hypothetical protein